MLLRVVALLVLLSGTALAAEPVDLLLLAATDAELQPLASRLESPHTETHAAWTIQTGTLAGKKVALARTEGDPLNAVAATTLALRRHPARLVVTFGTARAHDPALTAGDVVVSGKFAAFDGMVSPPKKVGAGSDAREWHVLPHLLIASGEKEEAAMSFPADASALAILRSLSSGRGRLIVGVLGSANQMNREVDRIAHLREQWGTSCEDGESAHIAGCAQLFGVPCAGLRIIDGNEGEAAALVLKFVEVWK